MIIQGLRFIGIVLLASIMLLISCKDKGKVMTDEAISQELTSFIVAGHAYGKPGVDNEGFHPPFSSYLESAELSSVEYGFLTGDIVIQSTEKDWIDVKSEMARYSFDWHLAPGNHDLINKENFDNAIGRRFYSFEDEHAVYLMLSSTDDGWSFLGEQLELFRTALETADSKDLLFIVFMHHLAWYEEDNKYAACEPNWKETKTGESNFLTALVPMIEATKVQAYIFAGDVGVRQDGCSVMYDDLGDVKFVASGMGGGNHDNIIKATILDSGEVTLDIIALNGNDQRALGEIEDWQI